MSPAATANRLLRTLALALLALLAGAVDPDLGASPGGGDEELDQAEKSLRLANLRGDREKRLAALELIVELGDDDGVAVLRRTFESASRRLREARSEDLQKTYAIEGKQILLEEFKLRAEGDPSARSMVAQLSEELEKLEQERDKARQQVERDDLCCEDLARATTRLFATFGSGKRKKLEKGLWEVLEKGPREVLDKSAEVNRARRVGTAQEVLGAVELLALVGGPGSAVQLQKAMAKIEGERVKLKRQLPKLEVEAREMERRLQEEAERTGGMVGQDTSMLYDRAKEGAVLARTQLHYLGLVCDAAVEAGGAALARETGEELTETLEALLKAQRKGQGGVRMRTLRMISLGATPEARAALRGLLAAEAEPLARAVLIDGLAAAGDQEVIDALIETYLADDSWHVRSRAVAALDQLRTRRGIEPLIERLAAEHGRLLTDVRAALESLTGQKLGSRPEVWRRWWADNGADFEVPELEELERDLAESARESLGLTFFGIRTDSERVIFILDVSGSMNEPMFLRSGTSSAAPRAGGETRLSVAKRELTKAIGGIPDGGVFNIVRYASDIWQWQEELLTMESETRSSALAHVDSLAAVGGTNIYGALQRAFDLAEAREGDEWHEPLVDTIFLLSDGVATVGVTTAADEILGYVRDRNRAAGIVIHTIGLSNEHDVYLMRSLAEQNGGSYAAP